jgi:hypothetical protein
MGKNNKGSKSSGDKAEGGGKAKAGAQLINVRHILVRTLLVN